MRSDLLGDDFPTFSHWCRGLVGHCERFYRPLYRQVVTTGRFAPAELPEWQEAEASRPGTIATLCAAAVADQAPTVVSAIQAEDPEHGTTTKLLVRLGDGREVETVHIPMRAGAYHTVCVSSQVGCKMGCTFCRTATMGLVRNLTAHEIVAQVVAAARHTGVVPRNVVFMGMGEPLDNLDAVAAAVRVLTNVNGWGLAFEHITLSTVGRADSLARLREFDLLRVNLAVSLTTADDALRSQIMPVNRVHNLAALKQALVDLALPQGRRILVGYVLMAGVNDGVADADRLAAWCAGLPVMINLIPFNPIPGSPLQCSSDEQVLVFRGRLKELGVPVRRRTTKGDGVLAACGQLATASPRRVQNAAEPTRSSEAQGVDANRR